MVYFVRFVQVFDIPYLGKMDGVHQQVHTYMHPYIRTLAKVLSHLGFFLPGIGLPYHRARAHFTSSPLSLEKKGCICMPGGPFHALSHHTGPFNKSCALEGSVCIRHGIARGWRRDGGAQLDTTIHGARRETCRFPCPHVHLPAPLCSDLMLVAVANG